MKRRSMNVKRVLEKFEELQYLFYSSWYDLEEEDIDGCLNSLNILINELGKIRDVLEDGKSKE
ncbi:MAG: hypothetical protein QW795_06525 [Candidatus Bathyarchaeia archaeon]